MSDNDQPHFVNKFSKPSRWKLPAALKLIWEPNQQFLLSPKQSLGLPGGEIIFFGCSLARQTNAVCGKARVKSQLWPSQDIPLSGVSGYHRVSNVYLQPKMQNSSTS